MQIEKQINIKFRWWNNDVDQISPDDAETLEQAGFERIVDMMKEGYTSGELFYDIDDIEYQGWWDLS